MFKKIIIGILITLIVVVIAGCGLVYYLGHRAVPDYEG